MAASERRNVILFVLGLLVAFAGWRIGPGSIPAPSTSIGRGQLVFPGLTAKLGSVTRIDITSAGKTITLRPRQPGKPDGEWGLESRGLYPIQTDKLRAMLTGLTLIRQVEPRTANPALYSRIGVEDAGAGSSTEVTLFDAKAHVVAALIVGHEKVRAEAGLPDEIYIRRPSERQSWLAEGPSGGGSLTIDADPQLWLQRGIVDISRARIASISVTRDGTTLDFAPKDNKLLLVSPANHPPLDGYKLDDVYGALQSLTLDDVAPATSQTGKPVGTSVFRTTDGLTITVHLFRDQTKPGGTELWAQFQATGKGAAPLAARLDGWTYKLGAWMERQLAPTMADLEPTAPKTQLPAGAAPTPTPAAAAPSPSAPPPATPAPATPAPATPSPTTGK